jgi:hypothetical protein
MRRFLAALAFLLATIPAFSQQWLPGGTGIPLVCAYNSSPPTIASGLFIYAQCDTNGKLITSGGGGGGGTSSNFNATFPTAGTASGYEYLSSPPTYTSGQMVAPLVDVNGNTLVNIKAGGLTGSTSNASSGVATSSTNLPVVSFLYGFNGTTWDQLGETGTPNFALKIDDVSSNNQLHTDLTSPIAAQSTHTVNIGAVDSISPYPATAVPITASATGTTAATTATLTAVTGHTTYICGFSIRANATAAATNNATVTGTISGTLNFTQWTAPLASGLGVTEEAFVPCIPASAVTTSIAVVSGAPGSGGVVSVTAWGYSI